MSRFILGRIAVAIVACAALAGTAVFAQRLLAEETARAAAFVAEGQHALAEGDRGAAVLALERARWLAPRAGFVRTALAAARVADAEPAFPRALRLVTAREWSVLAIGAGWIGGLGAATLVARRRRNGALWVALAAGVGFVVAMSGVVESNASLPAIVTGTDARVLVAPYATAARDDTLAPGTMVLLGAPYAEFVQVRLRDGSSGWVPRQSVEGIASPGS
ncbi:MAG TPA: hypothetical protein VGL81_11060 [Polyangiaceae bacterium]